MKQEALMNAYDIYNQRLFARADMLGVPLSGRIFVKSTPAASA